MNPTYLRLIGLLINLATPLIFIAESIHGPKNGPTKLDHVLTGVLAASQDIPEIADHFQADDLRGIITTVTNASVDGLNAAGVFGPAPATVSTAPETAVQQPAHPAVEPAKEIVTPAAAEGVTAQG